MPNQFDAAARRVISGEPLAPPRYDPPAPPPHRNPAQYLAALLGGAGFSLLQVVWVVAAVTAITASPHVSGWLIAVTVAGVWVTGWISRGLLRAARLDRRGRPR